MSAQEQPITGILNREVSEDQYRRNLRARQRRGTVARGFFFGANVFALLALLALLLHIVNQAFGLVVIRNTVDPSTLAASPLEALSEPELVDIIVREAPNRVRVMIRDSLSQVPDTDFTTAPLDAVLAGKIYPPELAEVTINDTTVEQQAAILSDNLGQGDIHDLVISSIVRPLVVRSWNLLPSLTDRAAIEAEAAAQYPDDSLQFRAWVSWDFITSSVSSSATTAGLRTALLGTFYIMAVTAVFGLPIAIGAAIYLEEYASDNWIERIIETNIRNLAAIPSVIYGMLGLAVFVRALGAVTSGAFLGITDTNGRTVLSAGLTLALLIMPVLIVNAQEAIRAVPRAIREASYGLGATRWQTVSRQVLPAAIPGILTGVILSLSRAIGETAPLLVVGASTFIGIDPSGFFSKFTVVPIQIYQWTSRPEQEFKNVAAAAIIVLLTVMILMNLVAIISRNRLSVRY